MEFFKLTFRPRPWAAVMFLLLVGVAYGLFLGRHRPGIRVLPNDAYLHISNASISFLICAAAGYMWSLQDAPLRYLLGLGAALIVVNVVYELWIPVLNTPDFIDAMYGVVGTFIALGFILLVRRYGRRPRVA